MPIQKPKYLAVRKFTKTTHRGGEKEVIQISAGEVYQAGEYFSKGEFLQQKNIDQFIADGILQEQTKTQSPKPKAQKDEE